MSMPSDLSPTLSRPPLNAAAAASAFAESTRALVAELARTLGDVEPASLATAALLIAGTAASEARIFTYGAGRSGLALQMAAMRLMHLGLKVHVAGEVTAPAIGQGDLLIVASASGASASAVHLAEVAIKQQAAVLAITAQADSPISLLATEKVVIHAATKQQFSERASQQYAGSLFEQSVLLVFDALFHGFWKASGATAETLMKRHANLE